MAFHLVVAKSKSGVAHLEVEQRLQNVSTGLMAGPL